MNSKTVFLSVDIETLPTGEVDFLSLELPDVPTEKDVKLGKMVNEEKIQKKIDETLPKLIAEWDVKFKKAVDKAEQEVRKEGLNPLKGTILCLAYCWNDETPVVLTGTEEQIMIAFEKVMAKTKGQFVIYGHNSKGFDFNWIAFRAVKYNLPFLKAHFRKDFARDDRFQDTAELAKFFDFKAYYKLDHLCEYFGIESPKDGIDGPRVYDEYKAGNLDKIYKYCAADVKATRELFKKLY